MSASVCTSHELHRIALVAAAAQLVQHVEAEPECVICEKIARLELIGCRAIADRLRRMVAPPIVVKKPEPKPKPANWRPKGSHLKEAEQMLTYIASQSPRPVPISELAQYMHCSNKHIVRVMPELRRRDVVRHKREMGYILTPLGKDALNG